MAKKKAAAAPESDGLAERHKKAIKEIGLVGTVVSLVILGLTLLAPTYLSHAMQQPQAGEADYETMFQIARQTVPFTIAAVLVSIAVFREWISGGWPIILTSLGALILTTWLFDPNWSGRLSFAQEQANTGSNYLIGFLLNLLGTYFGEYQWLKFVSSIIIGAFGGWSVLYYYDRVVLGKN